MLNMALRSCRVYLRDRAAVFYSLLAAFIIIGLYVLFLGDMISSDVKDLPGGRFMMDSWIMAGLLAATSFTTTLGVLGNKVDDEVRKIDRDFLASPVKRWRITGGYMMSSVLVGFLLCLVTLALAEGYILLNGGSLMGLSSLLKVMGVLLLSVMTSSAMLSFLIGFIHTNASFSGISTVAGTLIGFLTGIYIPIGALPAAVQTVIRIFPISHAAALLRQIMTEEAALTVFAGAPATMVEEFRLELGILLRVGDTALTPLMHITVLAGTTALFFGLSALRMARASKRV